MTAHEIHLASRPKGWPTADTFAHATTELAAPNDGEVLVRNLFMSVDPYMRGRMNDVQSYVPSFQIGKPLEGGAVGEVVESRSADLKPGDVVQSMRGWRDAFVAPASGLRKVDTRVQPLSLHLGVLGMTGLTAWVGLNLVNVKAGDRVFVSGAAGAVGSVAGQLAKQRGCFVVGSAGSDQKVNALTRDFRFDAGFNYKHGDIREQLAAAAPEGIDVYFDNVGGDHLEAALSCLREHGRIAACGAISRYNEEGPVPGPRNMFLFVTRRLTLRGFIVTDHVRETKAFAAEVAPLVQSGRLKARETVVSGLENAPRAFLDMLHGANLGKMIVKI
ncbi:MAG TPA: NADP-dependent oxidoreductase [Vicinamibacterales bacterium]|nr:NADP-dependent oxidoreductase [Vicinamibacterales bacterium]